MGRPIKLSPHTQEAIVHAVALGTTYEQAATAAGVSYHSFRRWMQQGETATRGQFWEFWQAVERAEAAAEVRWLAAIEQAAGDGVWQAAAWKLERRYPERWGRRDKVKVQHSGEVELRAAVVEARTVVMTTLQAYPEALLAVADALERLDAAQQAQVQQQVDDDEERGGPSC